MFINTNLLAANVNRNLKSSNYKMNKTMEKLSSGYRINRAADDAAGLAISEKMKYQINGTQQASRNVQDGISLIQTAEGGMNEIHTMLQRMNTLANQASNGSYTNGDRNKLDIEFQQLKREINSIAENTNFNGIKLLNGSATSKDIILSAKNILTFTFDSNPSHGDHIGVGHLINMTKIDFNLPGNLTKDYHVPIGSTLSETLNNLKLQYDLLKSGDIGHSFDQDGVINTRMYIHGNKVYVLSDEPLGGERSINIDAVMNSGNPASITIPSEGKDIEIQKGFESDDSLLLDMPNVTTEMINVSELSISSIGNASNSIALISSAINKVSTERAKLGAYQNRLEHTLNNLHNSEENLSAAHSRIRDADMAQEMTTFTKNQILVQAGTSMLAQANAIPQNILKLLG